jgi:hypothetical protein
VLQTPEFRKSEKLPESFTSEQPGEPEPKMPKKSHSNGSYTVDPQMWSKAPCKTESEGLKGSRSLVETPIHCSRLWYSNLMMNSIDSFLP